MNLWKFFHKGHKPGDFLWNKMPKIPKDFNVKLPANLNVKSATDFLQQMGKMMSNPAAPSGPAPPRVHMKYPYTLAAKVAQFPYKFYYDNNWIAHYYPWGLLACLPVFWYISRMANSKSNKAKWKEIRRLEREEALHKFD